MKKAFGIVLSLLLVAVVLDVWLFLRETDTTTVIERDTVWKDTTIYVPTEAETIQTGRVVYIKVPMPIERDTLRDTIRDSIDVPIPIMQKRYDDSLYTAWVSGFEPNLDSLRLHLPEITTTITKTIVKPSPLITVGIQTGGGYGVFNRQFDVYLGFGAQVNLWRK
jgi:hypothetical protein